MGILKRFAKTGTIFSKGTFDRARNNFLAKISSFEEEALTAVDDTPPRPVLDCTFSIGTEKQNVDCNFSIGTEKRNCNIYLSIENTNCNIDLSIENTNCNINLSIENTACNIDLSII